MSPDGTDRQPLPAGLAADATAEERRDLERFWRTLQTGVARPSRRDLLRWTALAAGAAATARVGGATAAGLAGRTPAGLAAQTDQVQTGAQITVPFDPFGQVVTLDPHRTTNSGAFWVMFPNVWGGLVRYKETGAVELDLAETYTVTDGGKTYTFKIRSDAKYANGRPVKADHFVKSWQRALDPDVTSPMAMFMSLVQGYDDYVNKRSDKIGFKAVDDATVQIQLSQPYNYFLSYLAAFVWAVVDPDTIAREGEDAFLLKDAGTGPWRFTAFTADTSFVMEPNTHYYGGANPSIVKITWPIVTGPTAAETALNLYQTQDAVSADVPISLLDQVQGDQTLAKELVKVQPAGTTLAIAMDFKQPPFDDVRVRRALGQAVDRAKWASQIEKGTYSPTIAFTPPIVTTLSGYQPPDGLKFDADAAKKSLSDAGYKDPAKLPTITFYQSSDDPQDAIDRNGQLLKLIKDAIGVTIVHDTSKTADQIQRLQSDNGGRQFDIIEWQTITETPQLLSFVFRSDSPYMNGWFNWNANVKPSGEFKPGDDAKQFDDLMKQADVEQDKAKRNDLYKQGEALVLKNAVYVPLGNWIPMFVQKPWLKGSRQGAWTGRLPALFDKDVVVLKHG